jgi:hypothetical protein
MEGIMELELESEWLKAYLREHGGALTISRRAVVG